MVDHFIPDKFEASVQTIAGQPYVFGLVWYQGADIKLQDRWRKAKSFAEEREFDLFLSFGQQYATGVLEDHQSGAFSAAASLAARFNEENILGIFALENDRYWVFASLGGAIEGDGDAVFEDEEEALDHFLELDEIHDFDRLIADESFNIEDSEPLTFEELLPGPGKPFVFSTHAVVADGVAIAAHYGRNLQDLAREKPKWAAGLAAAVTLPLLAFAVAALLPEEEPLIIAEPVQEITVEEIKVEEDIILINRPYEGQPSATGVIDICVERMKSLVQTVKGWSIENVYCTPHSANLNYHRRAFSSRQALEDQFRDTGMVLSYGSTGDAAIVENRLGQINARERETLWGYNAVRTWAHDRAVNLGVDLKLEEVRSVRRITQDPEKSNVTHVDLPSLKFTLETKTRPQAWSSLLAIPGTIVDSADWSIEKGWHIEGRIYADEIDQI